jgi:HpcH/HpaI aldolase/citrate lyase family
VDSKECVPKRVQISYCSWQIAPGISYSCRQVETKECVLHLDEVLSVPGIDIAFVGPIDLCYSLGLHLKYTLAEMFDSAELKVHGHVGQTDRHTCRDVSLRRAQVTQPRGADRQIRR